jgi:tetratricopeptide (TPR) repeat protein
MRFRDLALGFILALTLFALPGAARATTTDEADSLYTLAGELYAQKQYGDAIPLFVRIVDLDPRHANAFALLGGAYFQLGDHTQAIRAFERALQLDEGIKLAYLGLVASNYLTRRIESAQEWVTRMVPILTGEERAHYLAMISAQFPELSVPGI